MAPVRISKTATQALEWLQKMGIEVKPAIESGEMYEFEYENILQMLDKIVEIHNTFLAATMIAAAPLEDWFPNNLELHEDDK